MIHDENVIDLINNIKKYINTNPNFNYDEFYKLNKKTIDNYVIYTNTLTSADVIFLFSIVKDNLSINSNLIYNLFKFSKKKIEMPVVVSKLITKISIDSNKKKNNIYNYIKLLDEIFIIKANPKFIFLLWHSKNDKIVDLEDIMYNVKSSSLTQSYQTNYKIIKIDYDTLFKYFKDNEAQLIFQKNFVNFNDLNRVIGIPISSSNYKLNYMVDFIIDKNVSLIYNIYDTISTNTINLYSHKFNEKVNFNNLKELVDKTINPVIEYLFKTKKINNYVSLFLSNNLLTYYLEKIYNKAIIQCNTINLKNDIYIFEQKEKIIQTFICIHVDDYKNLFKDVKNYYSNFNKFLEKYIIYSDNISICNICGEELEIFNFVEQVFLQKNGEVIITSNKINIFDYTTYNSFINASNYLTNVIIIFDNLFNTTHILEYNNCCRLIIDFLIHINNDRLEYENIYKNQIRNTYLFILRLNNKIFSYQSSTAELYEKEISLNLNIIICITLIMMCNFNNLFNIINKFKNIKNSFNNIANTEDIIKKLITSITIKYLKRLRIIEKIDQNKLEQTIEVYLNILTLELKAYYNIILKKYYNNFIKLLKNNIEIEVSDLQIPKKRCELSYFTITPAKRNKILYTNIVSYNNINMNIFTYNINNFYIDIVKIMNFDLFDTIKMTEPLLNIIKNAEPVNIEYNNNPILSYSIQDDIIIINITKNKIINIKNTDNLFYINMFTFIGNKYFYFLNMSILLPIYTKFNKNQFEYIMETYNSFLNIFYDTKYFLIDSEKIFKNNKYVTKEYVYYLIYNILINEYNVENVDEWINQNEELIIDTYNDNHKITKRTYINFMK
jgi:hypothetical protein